LERSSGNGVVRHVSPPTLCQLGLHTVVLVAHRRSSGIWPHQSIFGWDYFVFFEVDFHCRQSRWRYKHGLSSRIIASRGPWGAKPTGGKTCRRRECRFSIGWKRWAEWWSAGISSKLFCLGGLTLRIPGVQKTAYQVAACHMHQSTEDRGGISLSAWSPSQYSR